MARALAVHPVVPASFLTVFDQSTMSTLPFGNRRFLFYTAEAYQGQLIWFGRTMQAGISGTFDSSCPCFSTAICLPTQSIRTWWALLCWACQPP